jgi:hypothetical protein
MSFTKIHATIPRMDDRDQAIDELRAKLGAVDTQFAEIWVDHGPFPALGALINGELGWLILLRHDGDAGFSSRNPGYAGREDVEREYRLENGQVDHYPASWAYSTKEVMDALLYFARNALVPEAMSWCNDSGDGTSPNADA